MNHFSTGQLFVLAVLIWGTTWHAIVYQLAAGTPELGVTLRFAIAGAVALGLGFAVGAVLLSTVGSLAASRNGAHALPFWVSLGWSMLYGAALSALALVIDGGALALPTAASWWWSLAYLAGAGSLLAFGAFLTLQQRIGPGRAATIGVMTPVVALAVSTAFEGYRPDAFTAAGAAAAVLGNWLMLKRR